MSGERLIPITPETIAIGPINFSLYSSNPNNSMTLFAQKGIEITERHKDMLSYSNRRFFIRQSESEIYNEYTFGKLESIIRDDEIGTEVKAKVLHDVGKRSAKKLLEDPRSEEAHEEVSAIIDNHVSLLLSSPDAAGNMFALSALDAYTYSHSVNVASLNVLIMQELHGNDEQLLLDYGKGGMLHDIGKTLVNQEVLLKPGPLNDNEFAHMKLHPSYSFDVLTEKDYNEVILYSGKSHHERIDGRGYPEGLSGEDIPLAGRVTAVTDVYDAITSRRVYKDEMPHTQALTIMSKDEGHYDERIFKALLRVVLKNEDLVKRILEMGARK